MTSRRLAHSNQALALAIKVLLSSSSSGFQGQVLGAATVDSSSSSCSCPPVLALALVLKLLLLLSHMLSGRFERSHPSRSLSIARLRSVVSTFNSDVSVLVAINHIALFITESAAIWPVPPQTY